MSATVISGAVADVRGEGQMSGDERDGGGAARC